VPLAERRWVARVRSGKWQPVEFMRQVCVRACVRVRACERACVCVRVCVCVGVCARVRVRVRVRVLSLAHTPLAVPTLSFGGGALHIWADAPRG